MSVVADAAGSDLVVVVGGDGTMLRAIEIARPSDTPVLGVNLGHVGFLAEAEPENIDAVVAANSGHALAYGADEWTRRLDERFRDLFGPAAESLVVWNGTGANVMALSTLVRPGDGIVCTDWSHINVDETGAPERVIGAKLLPQPTGNAKLVPEQVAELARKLFPKGTESSVDYIREMRRSR